MAKPASKRKPARKKPAARQNARSTPISRAATARPEVGAPHPAADHAVLGRPTVHTPEIEAELLRLISYGFTLNRICREKPEFPAPATIRDWAREDRPKGFSARYAFARAMQREYWADDSIDISDDSSRDLIRRDVVDGTNTKVEFLANHANVQRDKLRVDSRKWLLAVLDPKTYGGRITHVGDELHPIRALINLVGGGKGSVLRPTANPLADDEGNDAEGAG